MDSVSKRFRSPWPGNSGGKRFLADGNLETLQRVSCVPLADAKPARLIAMFATNSDIFPCLSENLSTWYN